MLHQDHLICDEQGVNVITNLAAISAECAFLWQHDVESVGRCVLRNLQKMEIDTTDDRRLRGIAASLHVEAHLDERKGPTKACAFAGFRDDLRVNREVLHPLCRGIAEFFSSAVVEGDTDFHPFGCGGAFHEDFDV